MKNMADGYRFLIFNYTPGDEIYVFGFSRGAYTARSFVGLINACGIIQRSVASKVNDAIDLYRNRKATRSVVLSLYPLSQPRDERRAEQHPR